MPTEILECLSPQERRFRDEYNEILRDYMTDIDLNLTLVRLIALKYPFGGSQPCPVSNGSILLVTYRTCARFPKRSTLKSWFFKM